jgi:signal transduction histidine kinase
MPIPLLEPKNAQITFLGEGPVDKDDPEEFEFIIQSGKWIQSGTLYLYVFGDVTDDMEVIERVPFLCAATLAAGLFISFFAGRFMSGMMLRPVKEISTQMKAISASSLNERLPEADSKDELQELAHSFNLMIERLEKAFEKQKQFVSDASHELRTPLAVMKGHTAMLRRWGKEDKQTLESSLDIMHNEIDGMVKLIDKLLILARSENANTSLHRTNIEMRPFLQEIVDEARLISPGSFIKFQCSAETVYADRPSLKQVIRILLNNSIKYCPPPGRITLETFAKNGGTQINIKDEGLGIESDKLPFVFNRFFCADSSRTKKIGGTGLGLAIAKSIIDSHQGIIQIDSQLGKGTLVSIWLRDGAI